MRVEFKDFHSLESYLKLKGYKRYDNQKYKNEDFALWKSFDISYDDEEGKLVGYQIALLFYDTSRFPVEDNTHYGIQFEFVSGDKIELDRADFTISDNISIYQFEEICEKLYDFLKGISKTSGPKLLEGT